MNECFDRAADAIRGAGGWGKVLNTSDARHGLRGLYTAQIRCIPDKEIVIFVVAGPSNITEKYTDQLVDHFYRGRPRPAARRSEATGDQSQSRALRRRIDPVD